MAAYLLTWNPRRWSWPEENLADMCARTANGETVSDGWSTGNNKSIKPDDKVYLLRQGKEPFGIVASGIATDEVVQQQHWDADRRRRGIRSNHVDIDFDAVVDPTSFPVLSVEEIMSPPFRDWLWRTASGGIELTEAEAKVLDSRWRAHLRSIAFRDPTRKASGVKDGKLPEEVAGRLSEGDVISVVVNAHERNPQARRECLVHWGRTCMVCEMTFKRRYGKIGDGFIHVHHLRPLATAKRSRLVDPINDLRPVCPNCHAMLHAVEPPLTINQLKLRLKA